MSRSYRGRTFQSRWGQARIYPKPLFSLKDRVGLLNRIIKRANKAATFDEPKTPKWSWNGVVVEARTKSEARALLKKHFGLKRLPVGVIVQRVDDED